MIAPLCNVIPELLAPEYTLKEVQFLVLDLLLLFSETLILLFSFSVVLLL